MKQRRELEHLGRLHDAILLLATYSQLQAYTSLWPRSRNLRARSAQNSAVADLGGTPLWAAPSTKKPDDRLLRSTDR